MSGRVAQGAGLVAGVGSLAAAALHFGFGAPELSRLLERTDAAAAALVQIETAWFASGLTFAMLGCGLLLAALRRRGWLFSLGGFAALWYAAVTAAFVAFGGRWGYSGPPPEAILTGGLALASGAAALAATPRLVR